MKIPADRGEESDSIWPASEKEISLDACSTSLSLPVPAAVGAQVRNARCGAQRPHGALRVRPGQGALPARPARVASLLPAWGVRAAPPATRARPAGSGATSPRAEGAPGRRGRAKPQAGAGARRAGRPGAAPACARPPALCGSGCRSVRRSAGLSAPRGGGAARRSPGKARPAHLQPPPPRAPEQRDGRSHPGLRRRPPRRSGRRRSPRGSLAGAAEEARASAAVSSFAASSKSHPRALPSLAGCLRGSGPAREGGGEAAPRRGWGAGRAEGGVSSSGMGKAREGSGGHCGPTLRAAGEPGTLAVRPACCHPAPLGPLRQPRRAADSRGPDRRL